MDFADFRGTPPQPRASNLSAVTASLRPRIGMDHNRCEMARRMKRADARLTAAEIAGRVGGGATEQDILLALATLRSRNPNPSRVAINATVEAGQFLKEQRREGERLWETTDRIFGELRRLRALVGSASGQAGEATR